MTQLKTVLYKNKSLLNLIVSLILFAAFACTLVVARVGVTDYFTYSFLIWNLILAWIPLFFASILLLQQQTRTLNKATIFILWGLWLLFYPNAPYIITDLVHLKPRTGIPFWFDQILIMSFILNGLLVGFLSLSMIESIIVAKYKRWKGSLFVIIISFLSGFGIYLGRYERWNSWDIFQNFPELMNNILSKVLNPMIHPRTYGVTLLFGFFLLISYLIFKSMLNINWNINKYEKSFD